MGTGENQKAEEKVLFHIKFIIFYNLKIMLILEI